MPRSHAHRSACSHASGNVPGGPSRRRRRVRGTPRTRRHARATPAAMARPGGDGVTVPGVAVHDRRPPTITREVVATNDRQRPPVPSLLVASTSSATHRSRSPARGRARSAPRAPRCGRGTRSRDRPRHRAHTRNRDCHCPPSSGRDPTRSGRTRFAHADRPHGSTARNVGRARRRGEPPPPRRRAQPAGGAAVSDVASGAA